MLKKRKKASLSLSINAIVVLILAITMLGLGLTFIKVMFGKVTSTVEEKISEEPEPTAPTPSNPLTLSRESVVTRAKETDVLKVSFYNHNQEVFTGRPVATCNGLDIETSANEKIIEQGKFDTFNMIIKIPSTAVANTYLCQVEVSDKSRDFTIKIE